jgi:hypothetical protein
VLDVIDAVLLHKNLARIIFPGCSLPATQAVFQDDPGIFIPEQGDSLGQTPLQTASEADAAFSAWAVSSAAAAPSQT